MFADDEIYSKLQFVLLCPTSPQRLHLYTRLELVSPWFNFRFFGGLSIDSADASLGVEIRDLVVVDLFPMITIEIEYMTLQNRNINQPITTNHNQSHATKSLITQVQMGQLSQVWKWLAQWCCSSSSNTVPWTQSQHHNNYNVTSNQITHYSSSSGSVESSVTVAGSMMLLHHLQYCYLYSIITNHNITTSQRQIQPNHSQLKSRWVSWVKWDSDWLNDVAPSALIPFPVLNHNQSHHNIPSNQITHDSSSNGSVESSVTVTGSLMLLHQL